MTPSVLAGPAPFAEPESQNNQHTAPAADLTQADVHRGLATMEMLPV